MWKPRIKYYLTKNPVGFFLVLLNCGVLLTGLRLIPFDTSQDSFDSSYLSLVFIIMLFLDLPVILPIALILIPVRLLFGIETYLILLAGISFIMLIFYWFYIGKKFTNYFWQDESENNLSIT